MMKRYEELMQKKYILVFIIDDENELVTVLRVLHETQDIANILKNIDVSLL